MSFKNRVKVQKADAALDELRSLRDKVKGLEARRDELEAEVSRLRQEIERGRAPKPDPVPATYAHRPGDAELVARLSPEPPGSGPRPRLNPSAVAAITAMAAMGSMGPPPDRRASMPFRRGG